MVLLANYICVILSNAQEKLPLEDVTLWQSISFGT